MGDIVLHIQIPGLESMGLSVVATYKVCNYSVTRNILRSLLLRVIKFCGLGI